MPKQQISNVWIAIESGFHSPNAHGQPDDAGLVWIPMEVFYGSVTHDGTEALLAPNEIARGGSEAVPPEYVAAVDPSTGEKGERLVGSISLSAMVRGIGDGAIYASHDTWPLTRCVQTSMRALPDPASATDAVANSGADATEFEATTAALFSVGAMICANVNGQLVFRRVVSIDASTITVTPAWPRPLTNADQIRLCRTLWAPKAGEHGVQPQASVAVRYDLEGRTWVAYGCRLSEMVIEPGDNNVAVFNLTLRSAWIKRGSAQATSDLSKLTRNSSMKIAVPLGAPLSLADATVEDGVVGQGQSATNLKASSYALRYTANLAEQSDPASHAGMTELEVGSWSAQATVTCLYNATIESMAQGEERRTLTLGWGPIKAGCGVGACLGGACLDQSALPSFDGEQITLNDVGFMAGEYGLDASNSGAGNASFLLAFPL